MGGAGPVSACGGGLPRRGRGGRGGRVRRLRVRRGRYPRGRGGPGRRRRGVPGGAWPARGESARRAGRRRHARSARVRRPPSPRASGRWRRRGGRPDRCSSKLPAAPGAQPASAGGREGSSAGSSDGSAPLSIVGGPNPYGEAAVDPGSPWATGAVRAGRGRRARPGTSRGRCCPAEVPARSGSSGRSGIPVSFGDPGAFGVFGRRDRDGSSAEPGPRRRSRPGSCRPRWCRARRGPVRWWRRERTPARCRPTLGRPGPARGARRRPGSGSAAAGEPVRAAPAGTGSGASPGLVLRVGGAGFGVGRRAELVLHPVVGEQGGFLVRAELVVEVDPGGVLDVALLVGDLEAVADLGGVDQGDERLGGAEQAGVDQGPGRVAGLAVQVELADGPDRAAVSVDDRERPPAVEGRRVEGRHARPPCSRQSAPFGDAHPHCPPSGPA